MGQVRFLIGSFVDLPQNPAAIVFDVRLDGELAAGDAERFQNR
jgi:hypothetical protein